MTDVTTSPEDLAWVERAEPGWVPMPIPQAALGQNFVSGDNSNQRLTVRYYRGPDESMLGKALIGPAAQGPPGHAHGGSIAALLDELMGGAVWMTGHTAVSAEITVRYRKMLPLGTRCLLQAHVTAVEGRKVRTEATITDADGHTFSRAEGLFIAIDPSHFADLPALAGST
jgi:acyl-coenzyme A thioesterase PaaI-like protein